MSRDPFPGAPVGATYSEEGWLVIGDEAWTEHEWRLLTAAGRRTVTGDVAVVGESLEDASRRWHRIRRRKTRANQRARAS